MELTLVLGASPNPDRYSHKAVKSLVKHNRAVVAVGNREGEIAGINILTGKPVIDNVHTITLYLGPERQKEFYDYMLALHPKRIIFNPGAENPEFYSMCKEKNIEIVEDCTLVMLNSNSY
jgi:predicted CoA-binding protein